MLLHELLVAKLIAYAVEISSVIFIYDYLTNKTQKTKIGSNYSSLTNILSRIPQGSVLGPSFLMFQYVTCLSNLKKMSFLLQMTQHNTFTVKSKNL